MGIGVTAEPRLDARIEVHYVALVAEFNEFDARYFDRQIEQKIAFIHQRLEHGAVILARERLDGELDAEMLRLFDAARVAGHDADALERHVDMAQQQRQRTLADGTKTDDDQPALKLDVFFLVHFPLFRSVVRSPLDCLPRSAIFSAVEFSIFVAANSKLTPSAAAPSLHIFSRILPREWRPSR